MLEKFTHVKNPLTVVALFAGFAEVSGTLILPLIERETQATYVWFLMGFPTLLILLFFAILNWNHTVLYAPSDFKDEENFTKFTKASPSAILLKEAEEFPEQVIEESQVLGDAALSAAHDELALQATEQSGGLAHEPLPSQAETSSSVEAPIPSYLRLSHDANRLRMRVSTDLALSKLERTQKRFFYRSLAVPSIPNLVFDGVDATPGRFTVVEVKYTHNGSIPLSLIKIIFDRVNKLYENLNEAERENFSFILMLVVGDHAPSRTRQLLENTSQSISDLYPFPTEINISTWGSLQPDENMP